MWSTSHTTTLRQPSPPSLAIRSASSHPPCSSNSSSSSSLVFSVNEPSASVTRVDPTTAVRAVRAACACCVSSRPQAPSRAARALFCELRLESTRAKPHARHRCLEGVRDSTTKPASGIKRSHDYAVRQDHQFDIDIDMIRVIQQDRSQPDCLSVSSGYTTDQFVLGVPLGSLKTSIFRKLW
uniref:Uncharacterized protein n=1 Tax=Cucumis melo TaxID=3656 RepID=A0A9I9EAS8_CUCME